MLEYLPKAGQVVLCVDNKRSTKHFTKNKLYVVEKTSIRSKKVFWLISDTTEPFSINIDCDDFILCDSPAAQVFYGSAKI